MGRNLSGHTTGGHDMRLYKLSVFAAIGGFQLLSVNFLTTPTQFACTDQVSDFTTCYRVTKAFELAV